MTKPQLHLSVVGNTFVIMSAQHVPQMYGLTLSTFHDRYMEAIYVVSYSIELTKATQTQCKLTTFPDFALGALLCFVELNELTSEKLCEEFRFIPLLTPPKPNFASCARNMDADNTCTC